MSSRTKKFFSYYRPHLRVFLSVMFCALLVAGITLLFPLLTRYITKSVLEGGMPNARMEIYRAGAAMLVLVLIHTLCNYYVDYYGHAMGAMMESKMRAELFDHLQKLSFRFYDNQRTGQLMSRITNDLFSLAELYHHAPEDYLIYSVKFLGALIVLAHINPQLTVAVSLFLPFLAIFSYFLTRRLSAAFQKSKERIGDVNAQVEDSIAGIRVVKSFVNEEIDRKKFAHENARFLESRKDIYRNESLIWQGVDALTRLITVTVVVYGGVNIVDARLDLADLITFLLYIGNFVEPMQKLAHMTEQFQEGITGFNRFMEIMEIEPEIQDLPHAIDPGTLRGAVEFRNVAFRYRDDHPHVLRDISFTVPAGDTIAIVGSSGVGKTTLCSLIPRFYEVTGGEILLDGLKIRDIKLSSLRRNIGVVQQDVYLFAGTVFDNIRYGNPAAPEAEIVEAAKKANAHEFILSLPHGYQTDIGQRGVKLSGGQKQRLSIARVFLKDPPILILDEATSSLDNESEQKVHAALEALARGRTTFVIAHRLSTVRRADRILVLNEGGIEEQGTHEELLRGQGTYARLYALQYGPVVPAVS